MPLTFAHPSAVLPLFRVPFIGAALVAGSVSPDIPYFLRATGIPVTAQSWYEPFFNATTSHSPLGALTVSLPLALLLYLGMVAATRPVITLLPGGDASDPRRNERDPTRIAVRGGWVLVSVVIGIATHLIWDSVTHGWVAQNIPFLQEPLIGSLTAARLLQHVSSVLGLGVIAYFVWRRSARLVPERGTAARNRMVFTVAVLAVAGLVGALVVILTRGSDGLPFENILSSAAVGAGLGVTIMAASMVVAWWLIQLRRSSAS